MGGKKKAKQLLGESSSAIIIITCVVFAGYVVCQQLNSKLALNRLQHHQRFAHRHRGRAVAIDHSALDKPPRCRLSHRMTIRTCQSQVPRSARFLISHNKPQYLMWRNHNPQTALAGCGPRHGAGRLRTHAPALASPAPFMRWIATSRAALCCWLALRREGGGTLPWGFIRFSPCRF